jgi:Tol biopolymer transport system component
MDKNGKDLDIYTINATGGKPFQVTNNKRNAYNQSAADYAPTYSPDGKKIAFLGTTEGTRLYTISVGEGRRARVSPGPWDYALSSFDYSPNGKKIAYIVHGQIETINSTGGGRSVVLPFERKDMSSLSYSPDGRRIAYSDYDGKEDWELYTIPAGGGKPVQLTHNSTDDFSPSWGSRP